MGRELVVKPLAFFYYEIRIKGFLDEHWSEYFSDLEITHDDCGNTVLSGAIADQAALHGILAQIRDLGLSLLSLTLLNTSANDEAQNMD